MLALKLSKRRWDFPVVSSMSMRNSSCQRGTPRVNEELFMSMRNSSSSMFAIASSSAFITSKAWFSSALQEPRSTLSTERNCSNIDMTSSRVSNILQYARMQWNESRSLGESADFTRSRESTVRTRIKTSLWRCSMFPHSRLWNSCG